MDRKILVDISTLMEIEFGKNGQSLVLIFYGLDGEKIKLECLNLLLVRYQTGLGQLPLMVCEVAQEIVPVYLAGERLTRLGFKDLSGPEGPQKPHVDHLNFIRLDATELDLVIVCTEVRLSGSDEGENEIP